MLERVQSTWASDVTDPLSRQPIQHWSAQLAPLEYLGAHVTAPVSHQTGRTSVLDLRAATAFFGQFGIQWDLTKVPPTSWTVSRPGSAFTSGTARSCTRGG